MHTRSGGKAHYAFPFDAPSQLRYFRADALTAPSTAVIMELVTVEAFTMALIIISGYFVDTNNECVSPDMQVIAQITDTEPSRVSAEVGCYHDTESGHYWRTNSIVSDEILQQTSLVKHEDCPFIEWDICESNAAE